MESINNPVKKESNRKKKENLMLNKSEIEIVDICNVLTTNICLVSDNTEGDIDVGPKENTSHEVTKINEKRRGRGRPQRPYGSKRSFKKSTSSALNIYSPEKDDIKTSEKSSAQIKAADIDSSEKSSNKSPSKVNAFTIMMSTQNRTIGLIQSGTEFKKAHDSFSKPERAKRRLLDQENGGSAKRKLEETHKDEYVLHQLEKRAKRLQNIITKKIDAPRYERKKVEKAKSNDRVFHTKSDIVDIYSQGYRNSEVLYKTRIYNQSEQFKELNEQELEDNTEEVESLQNTSRLDKRPKRMSSIKSGNTNSNNKGSEKKDGLLGYFPKINTSRNNEAEDQNTCEKTAHREHNTKKSDPKTNSFANVNRVAEISMSCEGTLSVRSRRSCFNRIHSGDNVCVSREITHSMINEQKENSDISSGKLEDKIQQSPVFKEAICVNIAENRSSEERARKADSVFRRSILKPALDSSILQARKEFLMSGIPDKMKMEIAKQREYDECYNISLEVFFPKVSHVGCSSIHSNRNIDWGRCGLAWRESINSQELGIAVFKKSNMRPFTPRKDPLPAIKTVTNVVGKVEIIKNLKFAYGNFPTYRCYKQLRAKFKSTDRGLAMQQTSESFMRLGLNHTSEIQSSEILMNNELIFTEKYKPLTTDQVLVNFHPVNELKSFLLNWQNGRRIRRSDCLNEVESGSDSSLSSTCNSVVLYGPSSSGKTNAVFALANEMNFNVLEINAGMKRNGKKLLQELQEATQSHIVNNEKLSVFRDSDVKDNADESDSISSPALNSNMKQSLILIEDADIVFEQDSGFIEALYQLARTSKRPVIIISNSATCLHLNHIQKHSSVEFPTPDAKNISKFLSIMSLVENCPIDLDQILRLYLYNAHNLRKTILEMQFFIQTGGDRTRVDSDQYQQLQSPQEYSKQAVLKESECIVEAIETAQSKLTEDIYTHKTLFDFFTRNQNSDFNVQFPVDYTCLHQNFANILYASKKYNGMFEPRNSDGCLLQFYRNLSVACYLNSHEVEDWLSGNLQESIAHVLIEKAIRIDLDSHVKMDMTPRTKHTRQFLSSHLSKTSLRTNRSICLDYDPMLRSICRSENTRTQSERRGSRFYHYLRNICGNLNSFSTNMFESKCSILSV